MNRSPITALTPCAACSPCHRCRGSRPRGSDRLRGEPQGGRSHRGWRHHAPALRRQRVSLSHQLDEFGQLLDFLAGLADNLLPIPASAPRSARMLDQIALLKPHRFPTV